MNLLTCLSASKPCDTKRGKPQARMKDAIPMGDIHAAERDTTVFSDQFETLTGFEPMRWQQRLYDEHFAKGILPSAVSVPTGLGKTAVMAIWLIALAQQMKSRSEERRVGDR